MLLIFAQATELEVAAPSIFEEWLHSGVMKYMIDGGPFMWPILIMGIIAVGVIIERYRSLRMLTTDASQLREEVLEQVQGNRVEDALSLCNRSQGPVAAVLAVGLRRYLLLRGL